MRELKFRAWQESHKKMTYRVNLYQMGGDEVVRAQLDNGPVMLSVGIHCVIMQSTGLMDKNGKEIYEGDIVSYGNRMYQVMINFNGYYLQRYKLWNGKLKPSHTYALSLITKPSKDRFGGEVDSAEVIGNIYQNPELIQA